MIKRSYKDFLKGLKMPSLLPKISREGVEVKDEPSEPELSAGVGKGVSQEAKNKLHPQLSNTDRASFGTNQRTSEENIRLHKSMNDPTQLKYALMGMTVCVEWPAGKPRMYGKDLKKVGKTSTADYGYIEGTTSPDKMEVDCYVGPNKTSKQVFLLMQKPTKWDLEHNMNSPEEKWMLCFDSIKQAEECYKNSMPPEFFLSIGEVKFEDFKECVRKAAVTKSVDTEAEWERLNRGEDESWGISKSNNVSADWRLGYRNVQKELLKYLEGEQSADANQQTDHTAEMSSEPPIVKSGKPRYVTRSKLVKTVKETGRTPRPTSEGVMSRESERKANRTPLVRHTRLADEGQMSAIPIFPNKLKRIDAPNKKFRKSLLSDDGTETQIIFKI